jgi:hypothetical protein
MALSHPICYLSLYRIPVNILDELAAQVQPHRLTQGSYAENLIGDQSSQRTCFRARLEPGKV